jgi:hypothetical protein
MGEFREQQEYEAERASQQALKGRPDEGRMINHPFTIVFSVERRCQRRRLVHIITIRKEYT